MTFTGSKRDMFVYHHLLLTGDELICIFIRKLSSLVVEVAFRHSSTTFWTNVSSREAWLVLGVAFNPRVLIVGKEEGESSDEWRERRNATCRAFADCNSQRSDP